MNIQFKIYEPIVCFWTLCLLISIPLSIYGQNTELDSLEKWTKQNMQADSIRGQNLARLSFLYNYKDYAKGLRYGRESLKIGNDLNNEFIKARAYNSIGVNHYKAGEYEQALDNYANAVFYKQSIGDEEGAAITEVNMGIIYTSQSRFIEAVTVYLQALKYFEKNEAIRLSAATYNNLSDVYGRIDDNDKAVYWASKALEAQLLNNLNPNASYNRLAIIYDRMGNGEKSKGHKRKAIKSAISRGNRKQEADYYLSIANNFIKEREFDSAKFYSKSALKIANELNNRILEASAYSRLGACAAQKSKFKRSIYYHNKAKVIREDMGSKSGLITTFLSLGRSNVSLNNFDQAIFNYDQALSIASKIKSWRYISRANKLLSELKEKEKDFESAYRFYLAHTQAEDSISNENKLKEIARIETEFALEGQRQMLEGEQTRKELELRNEIERQRMFNLFSAFFILVALILLIVVYRFYRIKKKTNQELNGKNKLISVQKDELSFKSDKLQMVNSQLKSLAEFRTDLTRMIAHDMKNPLNTIIGLSGDNDKDKRIRNITQSGYELLNLVTNMLEVDKYQTTVYQPELEITPLDKVILNSKRQVTILLEAKAIRFESLIPKGVCVKVDAQAIKRVFVNLLSNAIKYSPNGGRIVIEKDSIDTNKITLKVSDEGAGISKDRLPFVFDKFWKSNAKESGFALSTGLGLTFCKMTIEAHGGTIWAESKVNEGTSIFLTLPIEQNKACDEAFNSEFEMHQVKKEIPNLLNEKERELIANYTDFLKELKVHQVSAISRVLKNLEGQDVQSKWIKQLQSAVYQADQDMYDELIQMID